MITNLQLASAARQQSVETACKLLTGAALEGAEADAKRKASRKGLQPIETVTHELDGTWARGLAAVLCAVADAAPGLHAKRTSTKRSTMSQDVTVTGPRDLVERTLALGVAVMEKASEVQAEKWAEVVESGEAKKMGANDRFLTRRGYLFTYAEALSSANVAHVTAEVKKASEPVKEFLQVRETRSTEAVAAAKAARKEASKA